MPPKTATTPGVLSGPPSVGASGRGRVIGDVQAAQESDDDDDDQGRARSSITA